MKIPTDAAERHSFFISLRDKCMATCESRREFYRQMRSYYLFGVPDRAIAEQARFNKIYPHIDQLGSFMFSPETTRFTINLGVSVPAEEQDKVPPMTESLHHEWHDSDIDDMFKQAVRWSAPYGKVLIKLRPKVYKRINNQKQVEEGLKVQAFIVEPQNFGVLREDRDGLDRQEAFCERFHISKSQLRNELVSSKKPESEVRELLEQVQGGHGEDVMSDAHPIDRLIVTAIQGDAVQGTADMFNQPLSTMYRPTTKEDLIECHELYVYDDSIADWRVVVYAAPDLVVWDRAIEDIFLSQRYPYIEVCLNPTYDYYWGHSEVERLVPLQDIRNERMTDILHLLKKQAHAPTTVTGDQAVPDELAVALDTPGGLGSVGAAGAEIKQLVPEIKADLWHDIEVIDRLFDEMSGLSSINQGRGDKGVRSEGQATLLSNLGSTRIRDRSLTIEDSLDDLATLLVHLKRRYDKTPMREESEHGSVFYAQQFPEDFEAKVDGHSNSPIFVENHEQKVFGMLDRKMIDREEALDLLDIPMRASLKKRLREKIEPGEAAAANKEHELKVAQILSKRAHGGKGPPVGNPQAALAPGQGGG
jgi:hypothetical protein